MKNTLKTLAIIIVLTSGTAVFAQDAVKITFIAAQGDSFKLDGNTSCRGELTAASPTTCEFSLADITGGKIQLNLVQTGVSNPKTCSFTGNIQEGQAYFTGNCGSQLANFTPSTFISPGQKTITVNLPKL